MPKKLFKRILPPSDRYKKNNRLKAAFGHWLNQPHLWALSRYSVSRAVFIGLFCCFMPMPGQMLLVALCCFYFRANLPLGMSLVWISNPITMIPMMYAAYLLGAYILGTPVYPLTLNNPALSFDIQTLSMIIEPLLLGCLLSGLVTASLGYGMIQLIWRWSVNRSWQKRRVQRSGRRKV